MIESSLSYESCISVRSGYTFLYLDIQHFSLYPHAIANMLRQTIPLLRHGQDDCFIIPIEYRGNVWYFSKQALRN